MLTSGCEMEEMMTLGVGRLRSVDLGVSLCCVGYVVLRPLLPHIRHARHAGGPQYGLTDVRGTLLQVSTPAQTQLWKPLTKMKLSSSGCRCRVGGCM